MGADTTPGLGCTPPKTLEWFGGPLGMLRMIDQTRLPTLLQETECRSVEDVWIAIRELKVRGAPAIGVAAAYAVVLGLQQVESSSRAEFDQRLDEVVCYLATSRPTAKNLFWALQRMQSVSARCTDMSSGELLQRLLDEARQIELEDREMCAAIGRVGAELLSDNESVLTHCNAGALATAGDGTALAVIFSAVAQGKAIHVYADETRPLLQGARLTSWELMQRKVDVTIICDSAAGWVMKENRVQAVLTGADRIAANGDAANKIGTYALALLARSHNIPFYIAAPSTTFDMQLDSGEEIPIEQRSSQEISQVFGQQTAPDGAKTYNPAFDVTPAQYISAIITERGLIRPVTFETVRQVLGR